MKIKLKDRDSGFTLIEILIVIGIIAILAAIVIVAINPARQFAQARNTQRISNVNTILNAVGQYMVDNHGLLPSAITTTAQNISSTGANLCPALVPTYIPSLPSDPQAANGGSPITDCASYDTEYQIAKDATTGRVTVSATGHTELSTPISVTR